MLIRRAGEDSEILNAMIMGAVVYFCVGVTGVEVLHRFLHLVNWYVLFRKRQCMLMSAIEMATARQGVG